MPMIPKFSTATHPHCAVKKKAVRATAIAAKIHGRLGSPKRSETKPPRYVPTTMPRP